jgi:hypothetical protein
MRSLLLYKLDGSTEVLEFARPLLQIVRELKRRQRKLNMDSVAWVEICETSIA